MLTKTDIEKYFLAEKQESLLFLAIGITALVLALVFLLGLKTPFYKGAAIPLITIGVLLGTVGYTVYKRSDADRVRVVYALDMIPGDIAGRELPRMETVMKNFIIYRYTEIALALAGLLLFFSCNADRAFWRGLGLTLAIMAMTALAADYFAEKRGKIYINAIRLFVQQR